MTAWKRSEQALRERGATWTYQMLLEHVVPEDRAMVDEKFRHATATGSDWSFDCRIRRLDGEVRWIWAAGRPRPDPTGRARRMTGIVQDITERKRSEERLRAAGDAFRHLVDQSPFGVYVVDLDFRLVRVSAGAQKVFRNVRPLIKRDFGEVMRLIWPEPFASEAIARFQHTSRNWRALSRADDHRTPPGQRRDRVLRLEDRACDAR
jgi:PAS domain-containing protein